MGKTIRVEAPSPEPKPPAMNALMSVIPQVVEAAVEQGHSALKSLRESAEKFQRAVNERGRVTVEPLLAMLGDIAECLKARKAGAKQVKNAEIDRMLIEAGVREPKMIRVKNADGTVKAAIGSKSGCPRFIALATFETPALWSDKTRAALTGIKTVGIQFTKGGERFHSPFEALVAGTPYTSVHDVWSRTLREVRNDGVPQPTRFEKLKKQAANLSLDERKALVAALTATVPNVSAAVQDVKDALAKQGQ